MSISSDFSKLKVDGASAFAAVCAYHPWRTTATRLMAGMPFTVNPKYLYAGFVPAIIGSHQLFVISSVYQEFNSKYGNIFAAVTAGTVSAVTATVCDAWSVRKQANISIASNSIKAHFRGFAPTVFRQMGLSLGMFVFPSLIEKKWTASSPPTKDKSKKMSYALAGGVAAAVMTHYPDTLRVVMQNNNKLTTTQACQVAFLRMKSSSGAISCLIRIGVLGIAFTTMHLGRDHFPKILNKQEI